MAAALYQPKTVPVAVAVALFRLNTWMAAALYQPKTVPVAVAVALCKAHNVIPFYKSEDGQLGLNM
jgi:uncharacterized protein (DUF2336 family)